MTKDNKHSLWAECRYAALEGGDGMATVETLRKACGENAKYVKSYQVIGINFLLLMVREGVQGSILADEMGLGKTAQTILFLGTASVWVRKNTLSLHFAIAVGARHQCTQNLYGKAH